MQQTDIEPRHVLPITPARVFRIACAVAVFAFCVTYASTAIADDVAPPTTPETGATSGRLLVGFKNGVSDSRRRQILSNASGRNRAPLGKLPVDRVEPRAGVRTDTLKKRLLKLDEVRYVEPDYLVSASKVPNDPFLLTQWGLNNIADHDIHAPEAWDSKTKCSKVAVLDTGVDVDHPDLAANIWKNSKETPENGKDDDGNGYVDDYYGVNVRSGRGSGVDNNGHGTHVAGIIAAAGDNGTGGSGVCWSGSMIMSVKFMGADGSGSSSDAAEGIEYAVRKGAKIINASFGSSSKSSAMQDAIDYAQEKGALIVVAAGNDGKNIDKSPVYPASLTDGNILAVAASTADEQLASFSNYGEKAVDVVAPGEGIVSTYMGDVYMTMSGTSMAAPFVAGMAGLLRAKNYDADYADLKTAIRRKVDKPSPYKNKVVYDGRANLKMAIDYIAAL